MERMGLRKAFAQCRRTWKVARSKRTRELCPTCGGLGQVNADVLTNVVVTSSGVSDPPEFIVGRMISSTLLAPPHPPGVRSPAKVTPPLNGSPTRRCNVNRLDTTTLVRDAGCVRGLGHAGPCEFKTDDDKDVPA